MTLSFPPDTGNHNFADMPTEYLQILQIVSRIAMSNNLGKKNLSFTINSGSYAGFLGSSHSGNEESFYFYSSLNPYKIYDDSVSNEIIRQAKLYGGWNASAYPNGTIAISHSSFRIASHVQIACTLAHEIAHVIDSHSFEESLETGSYAGVALGHQRSLDLARQQLSRRYEKLADARAWMLLTNAGYPRDACISTLVALHKSSGTCSPTTPSSTHPGFHDRLDALNKFISKQPEDENPLFSDVFEVPRYIFDLDVPILSFQF